MNKFGLALKTSRTLALAIILIASAQPSFSQEDCHEIRGNTGLTFDDFEPVIAQGKCIDEKEAWDKTKIEALRKLTPFDELNCSPAAIGFRACIKNASASAQKKTNESHVDKKTCESVTDKDALCDGKRYVRDQGSVLDNDNPIKKVLNKVSGKQSNTDNSRANSAE